MTFLYIDLHCDTLSALLFARRAGENPSISCNRFHIDLEKLLRGGCACQVFAIFVDARESADPVFDALCQAALFQEIAQSSGFCAIRSAGEIRRACAAGVVGAILSIEDASFCARDLSVLSLFHRLGVRMASLTWNYENDLGAPRGAVGGLTARGLEFVEAANDLGILLDISHLSDRGAYDLLAASRDPVIASHSNARSVCPHARNLTDDLIRKLADRGGVIGLNCYPPFLSPDAQEASFDVLCHHARHLYKIGGEGCIALGSDFDGFGQNPLIPDACAFSHLGEALLRHGFTARQVDAILFENALRVFAQVL
jgi:membrane dipeptidase